MGLVSSKATPGGPNWMRSTPGHDGLDGEHPRRARTEEQVDGEAVFIQHGVAQRGDIVIDEPRPVEDAAIVGENGLPGEEFAGVLIFKIRGFFHWV